MFEIKDSEIEKIFKFTGRVVPELVFFDFDRTLCVHDYSSDYQSLDDYECECYAMLHEINNIHSKDKPLKCMQWFAKEVKMCDAKLYCLTHEIFNLRDDYKSKFIKKHYSETPMEYLTVDTSSHKIDMIKAVARMHNIPCDKCMLIDDKVQTIYEATKAGIQAYHISNIMLWFEEQL